MEWEVLNIIGIMAFAVSGALVAMEEKYDLFGVYFLGFATAFGGGIIRNLLIGLPVSLLWEQSILMLTAFSVMTIIFLLPDLWISQWKKWGFFPDALGLAAFAVQGALYAVDAGHSLMAIIVAALFTGTGGGVIRDILAGRKPLLLRDEIYALWAILAGLVIGLGWISTEEPVLLYALVAAVVIMRIISVRFKLKLPRKFL